MYFAAFGEWPTPDPVSAIIGLGPTNFRVKGERVERSAILRKQSKWSIDSGLPEHADLAEHLESLLAILEEHKTGVREVALTAEVGIQCAAYWHTSQPGFHLSRELLSRVAALGLSLDFDMYCMGEEEAGEPVV
jgi:Domain of unknown function (DUF4279)